MHAGLLAVMLLLSHFTLHVQYESVYATEVYTE